MIDRPHLFGVIRVCRRRQLYLGVRGRDRSALYQRPNHHSDRGKFLGQPLFRMASLLFESGGGRPGFWQELGAAVLSPPIGFNRLVFGNRFDAVFPSHNPAISTRFQLGASVNTVLTGPATSKFRENEATADFQLAYGLPGKPGYRYTRLFDYFSFQSTASSANTFENIITRGLLVGAPYGIGDSYRGVWGL
ncbi:MAG: hypothetical protein Q7U76_06850 [Nitrospirota bacterium]|nr:hypothetical protein [Nitrospirota bacterium]